MSTEQEMRETKVPSFKSKDELITYITDLETQDHNCGTCIYAMSLASVATFNYMAGQLGVTRFQAGAAGLDILRRTRSINGPFAIVEGRDALYPQYNILKKITEYLNDWKPWLAKEAQKLIDKERKRNNSQASTAVMSHWEKLSSFVPAK